MFKVNPGSSFEKSPRAWVYKHLVQVLAGTGTSSGRDIFLMKAEMSYHFDHWLQVSKNSSVSWAGSDNLLGPTF